MYKFLRDLTRIFILLFFKLEIHGKEKIIEDGSVIFAANHISMLDPFMIGFTINREIRFLGKIELVNNPILRPFMKVIKLIPVDRSKNDIGALKNCIKALKNNEAIGIFPEGTRVKNTNENAGKSGVAFIAFKGNAPVQPITIISNYKLFSKVKVIIHDPVTVPLIEKATPQDYEKFSAIIMDQIRSNNNEC